MLKELFIAHRGKIIGALIGLIFGIVVLIVGFWKTVFLCLCILAGYWLGGMSDKRENFLSFLDKILPKGLTGR